MDGPLKQVKILTQLSSQYLQYLSYNNKNERSGVLRSNKGGDNHMNSIVILIMILDFDN